MILDTQEQFSAAQSVAAAAGDVVSTNVLDTGDASDKGIGEPIYLFVKMVAALVGVGASIQVVLQDSADNSSFADVQAGKVIAVGSAGANAELLKQRLPTGLRRYLRVVYRISGATTSAGTADAYLAKDVQAQQYGASGFSVQ
jgi:hypothetical protein